MPGLLLHLLPILDVAGGEGNAGSVVALVMNWGHLTDQVSITRGQRNGLHEASNMEVPDVDRVLDPT